MTGPAPTRPAGNGYRAGDRSRTARPRTASGAEVLDGLHEAGHLADIDRHFAALIADLDGDGGPELSLAAALASAWTRGGHACIALREVAGRDWPRAGAVRLPDLDAWIAALDASAMVGRPGDAECRPLVLDGRGRLYLERLWTAERTVATGLLGLAADTASGPGGYSGTDGYSGAGAYSGTDGYSGAGAYSGTDGYSGTGGFSARDGHRPRVEPVVEPDVEPRTEPVVEPGAESHRRRSGADAGVVPEELEAALDRLFPDTVPGDRTRAAVRTAACRRLCVVSGGPGTGKTTIAAAIVALLIELGLAAPDRIALAAPTGKAAARLQEAVRGRHRELVSRVPALERYEARATTVHRWLISRARYRLPVEALILDEGSMVDLTLMAKVVAALPDGARLVLLGDASQLASVQPGAVFADVCRAGTGAGDLPGGGDSTATETAAETGTQVTTETAAEAGIRAATETAAEAGTQAAREATTRVEADGGEGVATGAGRSGESTAAATGGVRRGAAAGTGAGGDSGSAGAGGAAVPVSAPLASCVVELVRNWRFDEAGGIGRLAAAVVRGDASAAIEALRDPSDEATALRPLADADRFERLATAFADDRFAPVLREMRAVREPGGEAGALSSFRVLCAHRTGAFGAERFNRLVERRLGAVVPVPAHDAFYPGRPLLVTRNDPRTGLSNGDTGIVLRDADGRTRVWFPELRDAEGGPRLVAPARLPPHESFFAVTVHRAQGSEYDEVAVVPGPAESRVATRELLYTAVTRARRRVVVYGSEDSVRAAIERATERSSGLRDALCAGPGRLRFEARDARTDGAGPR